MAILYVRSTDGSDADNGSTWALAKATISGALTAAAAGDTIYVSHSHAESTAGSVTWASAGTVGSPVRIICANDIAEPPTAVATSATVAVTGNNSLSFTGSVYVEGLTITVGSGGSLSTGMVLAPSTLNIAHYKNCSFALATTNANGVIRFGPTTITGGHEVWLENCNFKFANAGQILRFQGIAHVIGGSATAGGTSPTNFLEFVTGGAPMAIDITGFDFSNWSAGLNLARGAPTSIGSLLLRNCKMPASWSGGIFSTASALPGIRAQMHNCAAGDTNYALWIEDYNGTVKHETTLVMTGGASDGTTPISWKMESSAGTIFPLRPLRTQEFTFGWIESVGSAITASIEILRDSVTNLKDDEAWLELDVLSTSGFPLSARVSDAKATILTTAADQAGSAVTWTTTGMTNPNKQKLSASVTPQEKGVLIGRVCLAKPSATLYVAPPYSGSMT